jgi:hypothetical protein
VINFLKFSSRKNLGLWSVSDAGAPFWLIGWIFVETRFHRDIKKLLAGGFKICIYLM